jgi:hypothetical protein
LLHQYQTDSPYQAHRLLPLTSINHFLFCISLCGHIIGMINRQRLSRLHSFFLLSNNSQQSCHVLYRTAAAAVRR